MSLRLFLLMILFSSILNAQTTVDSLKAAAKTDNLIDRVDAYLEIASEYNDVSTDSMIHYAHLSYFLSDSIGYELGFAQGAHAWAMAVEDRGNHDMAFMLYSKAIKYKKEQEDSSSLAASYNGLAIVYHRKGDYENAQINYLKAKSLWDNAGDTTSGIMVIGNVGMLYQDMGNWERAHERFTEQLKQAEEHNLMGLQATAHNALGTLFQEQENYQQAKVYFQTAMEIYKRTNNIKGVANGHNNLAITYFFDGDFDKSKSYFERALEMRRDLGDPVKVAESFRNLGDFHMYQGGYKEALEYYEKAIGLAEEANSDRTLFEIYAVMAEAYDSLGDYRNAYLHFKQYSDLGDKLINESNSRNVYDMEMKYEGEAKDRENASLRKEKQDKLIQDRLRDERDEAMEKNTITIIICGAVGLLFMVVLTIMLYRGAKKTKEDNSNQKLLNRELESALNKAKELSDLKSRFVTVTSHQFRTPMAIIQSNTDLIDMASEKSSDAISPLLNKATSRIKQEIGNMVELMDDILILGRISEGNSLKLNKKPTDLIAFCESLVSDFDEAESNGRQVKFEVLGAPKELLLDKKLIRHALVNLLSNALKYSVDADPMLQLKFNTKFVSLSVVDKGIGIPTVDMPNLFQPFQRAGNVGAIKGTGLGLSISKEYVELHGGTMQVESKLNEGSSFTITLPI